ncbi:MAG: phytanoyl-CoA dioxygenase family protein [Methylococcales bacterium]|nr:phytanoyl-CoA dioxygenase family protein [Methylococcales bacterium]
MRLLQLLKLPLSAAQVFTGGKSFVDNPLLGSRRLNARGLHRWRCAAAARMAAWRRKRLAGRLEAADRRAFDSDGIVVKPDFLPAEDFARLREEILGQSWQTLEMRQGPALTRRGPLDPGGLAGRAPTLGRLVNDARVLNLIRYAAATDGQPVFALQAIVADAGKPGDDPQTIPHQDTFHAVAKAWFFIQDVGPEDGPFFYVPGSHRQTPDRLNWAQQASLAAAGHSNRYHARGSFRIDNAELAGLGFAEPTPLTVRANTLVVADTCGFHGRTPSPRPTVRVELYASLRRNPFLPWLGLHVWSLPLLGSRAGSIELLASRVLGGYRLRWLWPLGGRKAMDAPAERDAWLMKEK